MRLQPVHWQPVFPPRTAKMEDSIVPPELTAALGVLEYGAVRERVTELASNRLGQERARAMLPSPDEPEVRRRLTQTTEAVRLFDTSGHVPLGGIHDVRAAVRAGAVGGMLEPAALLEVAYTIGAARRLKLHLQHRHDLAPTLAELAERIEEFPEVECAIREVVNEQGEVRDEASPLLARLRREARTLRGRMTERLNSILRSPAYRDMIQDPIITTRDGRLCIPVKSECRSQFGGLIHDQSSSGATVFMEPAPVVELGNELRQTELRERQEVERLLREVTAKIGARADDLSWALETLAELDFIFARARFAAAVRGAEPEVNDRGAVHLRRARHPLLTGDVVPIDITLSDGGAAVMIITGPNTGGKTVSLKTLGLLALMAQSGLHVPADPGSTLPVFSGIYADIGDEQSIQQSLSTFSGHVRNIARILEGVEETRERSLVLLDEIGAGTDPAEGAALAKAILHRLLERGARTIATTHYGELKEFAYATEGVQNASVEFDEETLRPTYRLLTGIPGSSNALSIAARLGLTESIIHEARAMLGAERTELGDVIRRLTEEQRATEAGLRRASAAAREAEARREQMERDLRQVKADRADTLARARTEAEELVRAARREVEQTRQMLRTVEKEAREAAARGDTRALEAVRSRLREADVRVEETAAAAAPPSTPEEPPEPPETIQTDETPPAIGDPVWLPVLGQRGVLLAELPGDRAEVRIGSMRTTVAREGLRRIVSGPAERAGWKPALQALQARASIPAELILRGLHADEALSRLEGYVDDACLAGLSPFRVVHGKGTFALKRVVWEYLQAQPNVAGFRHPPEPEGGTGVTVVELRE